MAANIRKKRIRIKTTTGTTAACGVISYLTKIIKLGTLFGKQSYNVNSVINYAEPLAIKTVVPFKPNQKSKRNFDSALYHFHNIVENTFLKFKCWRGIATRFLKLLYFFCDFFGSFYLLVSYFSLIFLLPYVFF